MFNRKARVIRSQRKMLDDKIDLVERLTKAGVGAVRRIVELTEANEALENQVADERTVNDILTESYNARSRELKVVYGENEKLRRFNRNQTQIIADQMEAVAELRSERNDLAVLVDEFENHEGDVFPDFDPSPQEPDWIDIGGEG